jgi:hypothetical protein
LGTKVLQRFDPVRIITGAPNREHEVM